MKKLLMIGLMVASTGALAGAGQNFIAAQESGKLAQAYYTACNGDADCMVAQAGAMKALIRNVEDGKIKTTRLAYCLDKYEIGPNKMPDMPKALYGCVYN